MSYTRGALWQSSFISQSIPVIDHPLRIEPKTRTPFVFKTEESIKKDEEEVFADPLNVHNAVTTNSNPIADSKLSNNVDGPLKNTLLENFTLDSYDNDPEFIGFKPWKEYRQQIQEHFHSKDLLSLETSFIKTSTTKHSKKKRLVD
jgi:hypothetical protein